MSADDARFAAFQPAALGLVLCGGRSRRMGRDKGLLFGSAGVGTDQPGAPAEKTWAESALDRLRGLCDSVALSIKADQQAVYARRFPGIDLIVDTVPVPGPMGAILSAYAARRCDLLVLAVDMIAMPPVLLGRLLAARSGAPGRLAQGVVFRGEKGIEPLAAFYTAAGLAGLAQAAASGRLAGYSLQQLPGLVDLLELRVAPEEAPYFRNVNRPQDLS